jgi:hypothetical protein
MYASCTASASSVTMLLLSAKFVVMCRAVLCCSRALRTRQKGTSTTSQQQLDRRWPTRPASSAPCAASTLREFLCPATCGVGGTHMQNRPALQVHCHSTVVRSGRARLSDVFYEPCLLRSRLGLRRCCPLVGCSLPCLQVHVRPLWLQVLLPALLHRAHRDALPEVHGVKQQHTTCRHDFYPLSSRLKERP